MWVRKGLVFRAMRDFGWRDDKAYVPTALRLADRLRVYFSLIDVNGMGRIAYADFDPSNPASLIGVSTGWALDLGAPGAFDEHGVTPLSAMHLDDGRIRLYYAGWQRHKTLRYFLFMGVAQSQDGGSSFQRVFDVPIIDRSPGLIQIRTGGFFLKTSTGWFCWYAEDRGAIEERGVYAPRYAWAMMRSNDGLNWPARGLECLPVLPDKVIGYGRSAVRLRPDGVYDALLSVRRAHQGYAIASTTSSDGATWSTPDFSNGLPPTGHVEDPDGAETAFPSVLQIENGCEAIFYNGDRFGEHGLCLALSSHRSPIGGRGNSDQLLGDSG